MAESNPTAAKPVSDPGEVHTPEDVATLYSWANLHGAKYRDFSASRAQAREEARLRAEAAFAEQRRRESEEAERRAQEEAQLAANEATAAVVAEDQAAQRGLEKMTLGAEAERQSSAPLAVSPPASQTEEYGASSATSELASPEIDRSEIGAQEVGAKSAVGFGGSASDREPVPASQHLLSARATPTAPTAADRVVAAALYPTGQPASYAPAHWLPAEPRAASASAAWLAPPVPTVGPSAYRAAEAKPHISGSMPTGSAQPGSLRQIHDFGQSVMPPAAIPAAGSPATAARPNASSQPAAGSAAPPVAHTTARPDAGSNPLQGSRDRLPNRWYALQGLFDSQGTPEQAAARSSAKAPVLAVFSLAGGVGKTSVVASLGRALSSRGERVLLVDTAAFGLLPFFFGARDQRPGQLRTFHPPHASADAPIQLVTFDPEVPPQEYEASSSSQNGGPQFPGSSASPDWLPEEVGRCGRGASRILIDLPTASGATTRRVLRMAPLVLVPVLPDMNSVVSVGAIEGFFRSNASLAGVSPVMPFYVLNQFDSSLPLHQDVREILREQIGDRLIPIALRSSPAVSEALAEGMTVADYAPAAAVAEDYANLAGWVRSVSLPAGQSFRGVRWSER